MLTPPAMVNGHVVDISSFKSDVSLIHKSAMSMVTPNYDTPYDASTNPAPTCTGGKNVILMIGDGYAAQHGPAPSQPLRSAKPTRSCRRAADLAGSRSVLVLSPCR